MDGSNAWQCLQQVAHMSRAQITQDGNTYSVWIDAPTDITQIFTEANIIKGSYSETFISLDDRASLVEVDFADALRNFRTDLPVSVMTSTTINSGIQPKISRVNAARMHDRDQAWAMGLLQSALYRDAFADVRISSGARVCNVQAWERVGVQRTEWSLRRAHSGGLDGYKPID